MLPANLRSSRHSVLLALLTTILAAPVLVQAESIPVRFPEGVSRGFLVLTSQDGRQIGEGDSQQVAHGDRVMSHLTIRFNDGSRYEDRTVFSQRGVFRLLTDQVTQSGPSFKTAMDTLIETLKGDVTVRYKDEDGNQKSIHKHMRLPPDIANGLLFTLVKDLDPHATGAAVSYLVATPQPRIVKLSFQRRGESEFSVGGLRKKGMHYVMSVHLGGIAGLLAPLIGKKPPDTDVWIIGGLAPTFARSRGPLYSGGPVWTITLVSPELSQSGRPGR